MKSNLKKSKWQFHAMFPVNSSQSSSVKISNSAFPRKLSNISLLKREKEMENYPLWKTAWKCIVSS